MEGLVEILLAGAGGQGLNLAGVLLARSFAEEEGKNVVESEAYGISMRGGHSRAEVLVSSADINDLRVTEPDILLVMSQATADTFIPKAKKSGVILVDSTCVTDIPETQAKIFLIPFTEEARNVGREAVANVVALGAIASISSVIPRKSLENTIEKMFGSPVREMNLQALDKGYELGRMQTKEIEHGKERAGNS